MKKTYIILRYTYDNDGFYNEYRLDTFKPDNTHLVTFLSKDNAIRCLRRLEKRLGKIAKLEANQFCRDLWYKDLEGWL